MEPRYDDDDREDERHYRRANMVRLLPPCSCLAQF